MGIKRKISNFVNRGSRLAIIKLGLESAKLMLESADLRGGLNDVIAKIGVWVRGLRGMSTLGPGRRIDGSGSNIQHP